MQNNRQFFLDYYWYGKYNGEELTPDFLNNWEYGDTDSTLENIGDFIKETENNGGIITELFIKTRVLKGDPLFDHLANGGDLSFEQDKTGENTDKEDKGAIFYWIAELYNKIERGEIETGEILEQLANIQQYAK